MTPERNLWQRVVFQAFADATSDSSEQEERRAMRDADKGIRGNGRDFRRICDWAGLDADFLSDAYRSGRVDARLLRTGEPA